jgi:hypothetical protein
MNKLLALVWGLAFLSGMAVLGCRLFWAGENHAIAKRQMPANHLILASDLAQGDGAAAFIGRYARRAIPFELKLSQDDISPVPLLMTDARPLFAVSVAGTAVRNGSVDAGATGKLCKGTTAIGDAEILALFCRRMVDDRCMALVTAAPAASAALKPNETEVGPTCPKAVDPDAKK